MRFLVLYLRSRQVPAALAAAALGIAALWAVAPRATGTPTGTLLGVLAVIAGVTAAGPGLAGPDPDLDRTAAIAWPPRRATHVAVAAAAVTGLLAATMLTTGPIAPAAHIVRDTIGMSGLLALGAATLGAGRAWLAPLVWTLLGWLLLSTTWAPPARATPVLSWMFQPASSTPAAVTAVVLGTAGTLGYAVLGPRR